MRTGAIALLAILPLAAQRHGDRDWKLDEKETVRRSFDAPGSGKKQVALAFAAALLSAELEGADAWITGIRREQAATRSNAQFVEFDDKRSMWKYNPLADWTERDLWKRIHERDLPYHPLHDQDYSSIGCAPCTQPGTGRDGRWAGTDKVECGLHVA
jgi:phosphoadenosine phosphosulfate reductase